MDIIYILRKVETFQHWPFKVYVSETCFYFVSKPVVHELSMFNLESINFVSPSVLKDQSCVRVQFPLIRSGFLFVKHYISHIINKNKFKEVFYLRFNLDVLHKTYQYIQQLFISDLCTPIFTLLISVLIYYYDFSNTAFPFICTDVVKHAKVKFLESLPKNQPSFLI